MQPRPATAAPARPAAAAAPPPAFSRPGAPLSAPGAYAPPPTQQRAYAPPPAPGAYAPPPAPGAYAPPPAPGAAPVAPATYAPPPGAYAPPAAAAPNGHRPPAVPASPGRKSSRINPAQMPRPTAEMSPLREPPRDHAARLEDPSAAPPPTCRYVVAAREPGDAVANCSPRYARCTTACLLAAADAQARAKLPLAAIVRPMAKRALGERAVDLVDFGAAGPPRCGGCKAYVNCFSRWTDAGDAWTCNLCGHRTDAPQWYQCGVDGYGLRRDRAQRPELDAASVDFVVKKDYCVRDVQRPVAVALIDAALLHVPGAVEGVLAAARAALLGPAPAVFGVVSYGGAGGCAFWRVARETGAVSLVTVPDLDEPFCPLAPEEWLLDAERAAALLDELPALLAAAGSAAAAPRAGAAALAAVADGLATAGGRCFLFAGRAVELPPKSKLPLVCAGNQVGVDAFWADHAPNADARDARALARLCRATGGLLHYYDGYDGASLERDVAKAADGYLPAADYGGAPAPKTEGGHYAHEAVLKVRCSAGLKVADYGGPGVMRAVGEHECAVVKDGTSFTVSLRRDGDVREGHFAFLQAALLYSCPATGRRLVRVHNVALKVATKSSDLYRHADLETCFAALVRDALAASTLVRARAVTFDDDDDAADARDAAAARDARKRAAAALSATRDALVKTCVDVLYEYRVACASKSPAGQLILPESIKLLPLLAVGALKGPLLRGGADESGAGPDACDRAATLEAALVAPTAALAKVAYPRLYAIAPGAEAPVLEAAASSGDAEVDAGDGRAFLLDAGHQFYVKLPERLAPAARDQLLGALGAARPRPRARDDRGRGTPLEGALAPLADALDRDGLRAPALRLVDEPAFAGQAAVGDAAHRHRRAATAFANLLVEDKTIHGMSYVDFLCSIHRQIQTKMTSANY